MSLTRYDTARNVWTGTSAAEVQRNITVAAGNNTQALAVGLTGEICLITTSSATASTGVRLPANPVAGDDVYVFNGGASTTLVYPPTGGTINALAANAGFSMAAGTRARFVATGPNNWISFLSA